MDSLEYLSRLLVTQGAGVGSPLVILPWQKRFLKSAFRPAVKTAALSVGRGNGKSTILSAVACAALDGPLAVPRGEVVIVASSYQQGRICFEHVKAFLQPTIDDAPRDWSVQDSANVARITYRPLGTKLTVRGSDPRRGAWSSSKSRVA